MSGSFKSREEAEKNTSDKGKVECDETNFEVNKWFEGGEGGAENCYEVAEKEATNAAKKNEDDAFKEELHKDVGISGADGFSNTNFVSAFCDGD